MIDVPVRRKTCEKPVAQGSRGGTQAVGLQIGALPGRTSSEGGVDNALTVNSEHVHPSVLWEDGVRHHWDSHWLAGTPPYVFGGQAGAEGKAYLSFVHLLLLVSHLIPNDTSDVLNHHGVFLYVFGSKQSQPL